MISIIIPALDEEERLPGLLLALRTEQIEKEVIVVDGGSRDRTAASACRLGATVLMSAPGRGTQIRQGTAAASGDILLFLHADTVFPPGGLKRVAETLAARPEIVGGNFRLLFDGDTRFSRKLTRVYAWVRQLGFYYGDSGIFVRRASSDGAPSARNRSFKSACLAHAEFLQFCLGGAGDEKNRDGGHDQSR